jgi:predicted nucleotidyltransferase
LQAPKQPLLTSGTDLISFNLQLEYSKEQIMRHTKNLGIEELLKNKREEILAIAEKHGAFNVRVFGSVARGEADEKSDIDFLIDYSLDKVTPWFPAGLMLELQDLLGRKVDVVTVKGLKERIRARVLQGAIPL